MIEFLLGLVEYAGPMIAAALTVPILQGIKALVTYVDRAPAIVKQTIAVVIAYSITELGGWLSVALPGDLALFTGADVEGLLSAGIAMAIHAGRKASGVAPKTLALFLFAGAALAPSPVAAQTDSATVTVIDRTDLNVTITPPGPVRRFRGDSVQFSAVAVDTVSGDTLDVEFFWSSSNSSVLSIDAQSGLAHFNSRGNATVVVEVVRLVGMIATVERDDGTWTEVYTTGARELYYARSGVTPPPGNEVVVNTWQRLCWYVFDSLGRIELAGQEEPVEYGIRVTDAVAGQRWDIADDGGPGLLVTAHDDAVAMTPPAIHGCPSWSEVLPTIPRPQQLMYHQMVANPIR